MPLPPHGPSTRLRTILANLHARHLVATHAMIADLHRLTDTVERMERERIEAAEEENRRFLACQMASAGMLPGVVALRRAG